MKNTVLASALLLGFASCSKEALRGSGDTVTETRTVSSFSRVELSGAEELEVLHGNDVRVEVSGYRNLVSDYETSVSGGTLELRFDRDVINVRNNNLRVRIYTPDLEAVSLEGSGKVRVLGNGDIHLSHAEINGSGEITVSQPAVANREFEINGSGKIFARDAAAEHVDAEINGSGDIEVTATGTLDATINGSGKIKYWGGATLKTNISGSGEVEGN
jgi:hypothetical protein